jgi:hypothetical protein
VTELLFAICGIRVKLKIRCFPGGRSRSWPRQCRRPQKADSFQTEKQTMMHYLSRSFVEFGPFPAAELLSFFHRGLLKDTDYVRSDGTNAWTHVNDWAASSTTAGPAPEKKATVTKAKPAPAVKAPAVKTPAPARKAAIKKAK